ncbi:hypothetical protein CYMTET_17305 [Cymbomonas tetramitiformis]|uniref:Uncharacterized protein n=1 Tax=Cymbomonas tetramitiformis TaxID=36881 RepID=A0AAE0GAJ9_9CHLO|nr:hypothetical protein CYMTET_17305 [Cymbomonas tetramitiformis]
MCRATGHTAGQVKQTHGYPEQYFARFPLPVKVVRMMLGRIRLDDVYNQIRHYPNPEHRSTALAQQMPERPTSLPVDKHYVDNWVIPFSLGHTVDLSVEWKPYQAAKLALDNVITPSLAKKLQFEYVARLPGVLTDLASFLSFEGALPCEGSCQPDIWRSCPAVLHKPHGALCKWGGLQGVLTEEFILCNHDQILGTLRNCNVAIQWLMLHVRTPSAKPLLPVTHHLDAVPNPFPAGLTALSGCLCGFGARVVLRWRRLLGKRTKSDPRAHLAPS